MVDIDKNLDDVIDKAAKTGEKIVTMECPCCHRVFYATENEAAYQYKDLASEATLKVRTIGRKCPYCGFAGEFNPGRHSKAELDREQMFVEMEAEQKAQQMLDENQSSWAEINNIGVGWKN